jgi:hypothetical protein
MKKKAENKKLLATMFRWSSILSGDRLIISKLRIEKT